MYIYIPTYVYMWKKTCVNCLSIHVSICSVNKTYNDCQLFFPKDIYLFLLCCLCLYLWSILKRLWCLLLYTQTLVYILNGQVINWLDFRNKKYRKFWLLNIETLLKF